MEENTSTRFEIVETPITDINPAAYNPRKISDDAFAGLKRSIEKFGMPSPLVVNVRSGNLVSGHQRLRAATELGWETVPVVEVDLGEIEEKALNVTLNNRHIAGDFTAGLATILDDIRLDMGDDFMTSLRFDAIDVPLPDGFVERVNKGSESDEWVGMPEFVPGEKEVKLILCFPTPEAREKFVADQAMTITSKRDQQWLVRF